MRMQLLSLALLAIPLTAEADGDARRGGVIFAENCAVCHGPGAMGDGPMAEVLSIAPPDLTGLSAANDGTFPVAEAVQRIDGRNLLSHGGAMPLFGRILRGESKVVDGPEGDPIFTTEAVIDVVTWLETVQR